MAKAYFIKTLFLFLYRILFRKLKSLRRSLSNSPLFSQSSSFKTYQKYPSLSHRLSSDLTNSTMMFNMEGALLRSSSLFPYFMLVAFEAGGLFRSIVLLLSYPFICLLSQEMGLKWMVMICFFGIKKESFRVGTAVLPKFYLEDVGFEMFELLQKGSKRVALTNFPVVMVESFLRDYLQFDCVVGRELKVFHGYFSGLMEDDNKYIPSNILEENLITTVGPDIHDHDHDHHDMIGVTNFNATFSHNELLSCCKDVFFVSETDKKNWQTLPRERYPKPLIFHDGRLALRPSPLASLEALMWGPIGFTLGLVRIIVALSLPYDISSPILAFSGLCLTTKKPSTEGPLNPNCKPKGVVYVCNHRTLVDPLYIAFSLKNNLTALTYSLSRLSEILAPIRTVRLTRNRDQDSKKMEELLSKGDLVVCPEGTTCREPYLLRFSPLFSEIADEIVPVAVTTHVSMFHGTTAGGLKCLDPIFFLMNPTPIYTVQLLEKISGLSTRHDCSKSRYDVANEVQSELGKALGYECTALTRRDKYLILAGNEGVVTCTK
ncbi:probable glycerol-3-phosphate acyltransferase 3 [Humulus lupulus]|uniref:probable glycerol-3-phosphate acyltransferase 3 n=1 Tax=Humulus lupulus TaxID=3486 RepID=UPI002B417548|nr:probable glycerol-3-phosphate acyltransferase 3 [Humulus lupulus]